MRISILAFGAVLAASPATATDFQPLREDPEIANGVLSYAVADFLRENCSQIEERTVRGKVFLLSLVTRAQSLGFSLDEATAYVDDPVEQERVQVQAMAYLRSQGLPEDPEESDWCRVGMAELDKRTPVPLMVRKR